MNTAKKKLAKIKAQTRARQDRYKERLKEQGCKPCTFYLSAECRNIIDEVQEKYCLSRAEAISQIILDFAKEPEPLPIPAAAEPEPGTWANNQEDLFDEPAAAEPVEPEPEPWKDKKKYRAYLKETIPKYIDIKPEAWKPKAEILNDAGIFSTTGNPWTADRLRQVCKTLFKK